MDYKERLRQWNSTDKYKSEISFVSRLVEINYLSCLDYGCGIGTFMDEEYTDGYDVNDYYEGQYPNNYYYKKFPEGYYSNITMIHVIAHIPSPIEVLKDLKERYDDPTITVITPNKDWLDKDYNNDPTVIKHYNQSELTELFKEAGYEVTLCGQFGELRNGINERIFLQAK